MDDWKKFGERISRRREDLGLTMDDVAAHVGVSWQSVSKWEKADTRPGREKLAAIAEALELDELTVVGWWAGISPSDQPSRGRVQERYDAAPPEVQTAVDLLLNASERNRSQG